ncbi:hypothetical protein A3850_002985 [Lewinella sp. 4G2]|nr:hypothetical protein A3850_002985 [Lewinella sp. 4G2]
MPHAIIPGDKPSTYPLGQKMDCNDAGDVEDFFDFDMQSNSFGENIDASDRVDFDDRPDAIYLCAQDRFRINHDEGTEDLSGVPNQTAFSGVGWAFYECPPTVSGPTRDDIRADPCVANGGQFIFTGELVVAVPNGNLSGDYTLNLFNNFATAEAFGTDFPMGGRPSPVDFYIAPITFDTVVNGIAFYQENGPCVDVALEETFRVVYLNAITVENLPASNSFSGCNGFFNVLGGEPEFSGDANYTITIENTVTGQRAQLNNPANTVNHNGLVQYQVPTAGDYRISIMDNISCELETVVVSHADGCNDPVTITFPTASGTAGTNVCFPVTVDNFTDVSGFQFEMDYDPAILTYTGSTNVNPAIVTGFLENGPMTAGGNRPPGNVIYILNIIGGDGTADIPDGEVLFEICFDLIGNGGDVSPVRDEPSAPAEFTRLDGPPMGTTSDINFNNGNITILAMQFGIEVSKTDEVCDMDDNGTITVDVTNTPGPITFDIRSLPGGTFMDARTVATVPASTTFDNLPNGMYEVRIVNGAGTEELRPVTINQGLSLDLVIQPLNRPTCNGGDDGAIQVQVFANSVEVNNPVAAGYTFSWEGRTETSNVLTGLESGSYEVTVTSPEGCMTDVSQFLGQPLPITVRPDNPADAVSAATCDGAADGSITITADGGDGSFDFAWPGGLGTDLNTTMSNRTGLLPGSYAVTVTDQSGCMTTSNFTVDANKSLLITETLTNVQCFGANDGIIEVVGSTSGAPQVGNFFFTLIELSSGISSADVEVTDITVPTAFDDLGPGMYSITLRDEDPAGCSFTDTFEITSPEELVFDEDLVIRDATCIPQMGGEATAAVSGGTMPYTYRWTNDSLDMAFDTITPGPFIDGLEPDSNYVLFVTDANMCEILDSFRISAPAAAQIDPIPLSFISCPGDTDGMLTATITPPPGETVTGIEWFRLNPDSTFVDPDNPIGSNATISDLAIGLYGIVVTTSNGCENAQIGIVASPTPVELLSVTPVNPTCPGDADGSLTFTASGGTPNMDGTYNYEYSTNPGVITQNNVLGGLSAGTYSVTITDANNCEPAFMDSFVLEDPAAITGTFTTTPVSCPDDNIADGQASFSAAFDDGTQGMFTFNWSNGFSEMGNSSTVTGLARGPISVTVTDGTCTEVFTDEITSPEPFAIVPVFTQVSCNGAADGSIVLTEVTGGTGDYTFSWTGFPDTDNSLENLPAGTYEVVITDENGCSPDPFVFTIIEPDVLDLAIDSTMSASVTCSGESDGMITVFVNSVNNNDLGDAPYTWSGNVADPSSSTATGLPPGSYGVTITDVNGCQDSVRYDISEPDLITFNVLPIEEPLCFGQPTSVFVDNVAGGTATGPEDYTFSVNNNGFRVGIDQPADAFAGEVIVTVFDAAGCSAQQILTVNQPPEIVISLPEEITIELGDTLTRFNPIVSPVGDVYSYLWTPATFLSADSIRNPIVSPFSDQAYALQVTNSNGCLAFADIFVNVDANRNVYIPNVFSPNGDGRNDDFRVFACQGVTRISDVQIYDRWGGLVYQETEVPPNCLDGIRLWNGNAANNKPVNPGVFVYMVRVEFLDGESLLYRGDVTVLK